MIWKSGLAGALLLGLVLGAGCGRNQVAPGEDTPDADAPVFRNITGAEVGFVGDTACFDCHESEWLSYQEHGMARSFAHVDSTELDLDLPSPVIVDRKSGLQYRVFREEGRIYQEEFRREGPLGPHRLRRSVDYVIGSGTAARTFLTLVGDRLYQMPLTWYTQTRRWDFSPGYEVANDRFNRLIPEGCLACHNDYPASEPFVTGMYRSLPNGIGCERCHGPGQLHVDERLAVPEPVGDYDDSIVNPALLDLERQLDVCQQCHLHATVSLLRDGRHYFDYRPGENLEEHLVLFAAHGSSDPGEIAVISHAERLKQSVCYTGTLDSAKPMTCSTCHNPHEGFRTRGSDYFTRACLDCHNTEILQARVAGSPTADQHTEQVDCSSCHMPKVEARDAPHASFTDHLIRTVRTVDEGNLPSPGPPTAELQPVFSRDAGGRAADLYRGMAYLTYGRQKADSAAFDLGISLLQKAIQKDTTNSEARYLLGWSLFTVGRSGEAVPHLEASVRAAPDLPERLNTLALAYEAAGRSPTVISRLYRRALSIQPELAKVRVNYGRFLHSRGEYDQAVEQYRAALASEPTLEVAAFNLGTIGMDLEAPDEAEEWFLKALELNSRYADALTNLGVVYASRGDTEGARRLFEYAVESGPDNASALANLGAFRVNEGAPREAIPVLLRAVARSPDHLDALSNLALAYFRVDNFDGARVMAERALKVNPDHALARQVLIAVE